MKENPQVQQVWIQVKIMMCFLGFIGLLVSYDVCVDNAQNKRLDCPQLQCIVIFSFDRATGFVKFLFNHLFRRPQLEQKKWKCSAS